MVNVGHARFKISEKNYIWKCSAAAANICKRHTNNLQPPDEC